MLAVPVASGLIVGEGVWALPQVLARPHTSQYLIALHISWGVCLIFESEAAAFAVQAILQLAQVTAPVCMSFFSGSAPTTS